MKTLGLAGTPLDLRARPVDETAPQVVVDLLGGDPIQRNLAADALTRAGVPAPLELRMAWIAEGLEDEYPSVRWFAWRGLRRLVAQLPDEELARREALLAGLARFDYLGPVEQRVEVVSELRARLGPPPMHERPDLREMLITDRQALAIWIGE